MIKLDDRFTTWDGVVTAFEVRLMDRRDPDGRVWCTVDFEGDGYCQSYRHVCQSRDGAYRFLGELARHLQSGIALTDLIGATAKLVSGPEGIYAIDNAAGDQLLV